MSKKIADLVARYGHSITVLGLLLAVVGLSLTAFQMWQASSQGTQIQSIASAVSTQYVGTFPDNLESIVRLVEESEQTLWIVDDVPAYGHFSAPGPHAVYRQAIERFLDPQAERQFRFLTYPAEARRRFAREQIKVSNLDELEQRTSFVKYYEYWGKKKKRPSSVEHFFELLEIENRQFVERLLQMGAEPMETAEDSVLPVFIWLSDDRRAIFSFYNYGADSREVSFRTNDPRLIAVLREIADSAFKAGGCVSQQEAGGEENGDIVTSTR